MYSAVNLWYLSTAMPLSLIVVWGIFGSGRAIRIVQCEAQGDPARCCSPCEAFLGDLFRNPDCGERRQPPESGASTKWNLRAL
jgi:hypothetical protein